LAHNAIISSLNFLLKDCQVIALYNIINNIENGALWSTRKPKLKCSKVVKLKLAS
jgi:hypothetical protein